MGRVVGREVVGKAGADVDWIGARVGGAVFVEIGALVTVGTGAPIGAPVSCALDIAVADKKTSMANIIFLTRIRCDRNLRLCTPNLRLQGMSAVSNDPKRCRFGSSRLLELSDKSEHAIPRLCTS